MTVAIRDAGPQDMALLDRALRALSEDLGDAHRSDFEALAAACHGPAAFAAAVLAIDEAEPVGTAFFSPAFSTILGGPGVAVSDLWVAAPHRGGGLGQRLLAAAARSGTARWQAGFLRLTVYTTNPRAREFYQRQGFAFRDADRNAILAGDGFRDLAGEMI